MTLEWIVQPPPGAAVYVWHDGTLRIKFDSTKSDELVEWAKGWTRLFVHYARTHKVNPSLAITEHPKTLEEIQILVDKINASKREAEEEIRRMQCQTCFGIEKDENEPVCPACKGTGFVEA